MLSLETLPLSFTNRIAALEIPEFNAEYVFEGSELVNATLSELISSQQIGAQLIYNIDCAASIIHNRRLGNFVYTLNDSISDNMFACNMPEENKVNPPLYEELSNQDLMVLAASVISKTFEVTKYSEKNFPLQVISKDLHLVIDLENQPKDDCLLMFPSKPILLADNIARLIGNKSKYSHTLVAKTDVSEKGIKFNG